MIKAFICSLKRFASRVKQHLKQWSKPAIGRITVGSLSDLRRSRKDLIIENAILRQQLIVLNRQVKRPQFDSRRSGAIRVVGQIDEVLAASVTYYPAGHVATLASRPVPPLLAVQIKA
jgi:hypothetical protein